MKVIYNSDSWPIVSIKVEGIPKTDEDMIEITKVWTQIYMESMVKGEKFKLIFDILESGLDRIELLKHIATFLVNVKSLTEQWMDRTVILVKGTNIRTMLNFVFMLYKPVRPFKVYTDPKDALVWLISENPGDKPKIESNISFD